MQKSTTVTRNINDKQTSSDSIGDLSPYDKQSLPSLPSNVNQQVIKNDNRQSSSQWNSGKNNNQNQTLTSNNDRIINFNANQVQSSVINYGDENRMELLDISGCSNSNSSNSSRIDSKTNKVLIFGISNEASSPSSTTTGNNVKEKNYDIDMNAIASIHNSSTEISDKRKMFELQLIRHSPNLVVVTIIFNPRLTTRHKRRIAAKMMVQVEQLAQKYSNMSDKPKLVPK